MSKKPLFIHSLPGMCLAMGIMFGSGLSFAAEQPTQTSAPQAINSASTITVTGTVVDENGDPIIGASVVDNATHHDAITDYDGNFKLTNIKPDAKITISYVGFLPVEMTASQLNGQTINMSPSAENLDEVIVVGYGKQKKINLTGAVQQVTSKELTQRSVTSASLALQGLVSGMAVTQTSGAPGTSAGLLIRGQGSINSDSTPLVLVDGVEGDMNAIDMNAIESISVLKDAASASIYGSKASNGVILVTTKRGQETKATVTYNGWVGFRTPTELPRPANGIEYMEQMDKAMRNEHSKPLFEAQIEIYKNGGVDNMNYYDTDWRGLIMKDNMLTTNHSISISGGNKTIRQYVNGSYSYEDGIVHNNNYNRWTLRSNTDATITNWLKASLNVDMRRTNREEPFNGATAIIGYALTFSPIYGAVNADGTWANGQSGINPLAMAEAGGYSHSDGNDATVKGTLTATPIDGLDIMASYSTRRYESKADAFRETYDTYQGGNFVTTYPAEGRYRSESWSRTMFNQFNISATYEKTFNKVHYLKVFAGFQTEETKYNYFGGNKYGFPYPGYQYLNNSTSTGTISGYGQELAMVSYIGRINYIYDEKYMIEGTARYDGSSRFIPQNRWGFFPSVSAGWRISQENFFEGAREYVNNLKLRVSYGTMGNQSIGGYYPYAATLATGVNYWAGGVYTSGVAPTQLSNRDISWEKSKQFNVGLDFDVLGNRLSGTFDYYVRNISSMLQTFPAPMYVGLTAPWRNAGDMRNNGWDLSLTYRDRIGKVDFSATAMLSDVKNKITDLRGHVPYIDSAGGTTTQVGSPIWSWYGYVADGYFQSADEFADLKEYPSGIENVKPGYIKYRDMNNDGRINEEDKVIIGDPANRYLFSLNLTANWNNFDFTAFFQGVGKRDIYAQGYNVRPLQVGRTIMESQFDTWSEDNRYAKYPLLLMEQVTGTNPNNIPSSFWIKSGAYMRLKNLVVGYTLPRKILNNLGIQHLRLYVSGQNLFTIQNAYPGYDPEASPSSYYPLMRIYTFGVDFRF